MNTASTLKKELGAVIYHSVYVNQTHNKVVRYRTYGMNPLEIASMLSLSVQTVYEHLREEIKKGRKFPRLMHGNSKYPVEVVKGWRELVKEGATYKEIAEMFNIHSFTVYYLLKKELYGLLPESKIAFRERTVTEKLVSIDHIIKYCRKYIVM